MAKCNVVTLVEAHKALRETEERYKALVEQSFDGIFVYDSLTKKLQEANNRFLTLMGYSKREIKHLSLYDIVDEREEILTKNVLAFIKSKKPQSLLESRYKRRDGTFIDVEASASLVRYADREVILVSIRDITERKRYDEMLREREEQFRLMFDQSPVGTAHIAMPERRYIRANESFCSFIGYSEEELTHMTDTDVASPEDMADGLECTRRLLAGEIDGFGGERRYVRKDGAMVWGDLSVKAVKDAAGQVPYTLVMVKDITDRKQAEERLREQKQRYRDLAELLPQTVFELDISGRFTFVNERGKETFGYTDKDVKQGLFVTQVIDENPTRVTSAVDKILAGARSLGSPYRAKRKDGSTFPAIVFSSPVLADGKAIGLRGVLVDISRHQQMEQDLKDSEEKFRGITESSIVGVYLLQDGLFRYVNPAVTEICGYSAEEIVDRMGPTHRVVPEDQKLMRDALRKRFSGEVKSVHYEFRIIHKTGKIVRVEAYGSHMVYKGKPAIVGTIIDRTVQHSQREAVRISMERYRTVFENTGTAAAIIADDMYILLANSEFERLSGYSRAEIEQKKEWAEFVAKENLPQMLEYHRLRRESPGEAPKTYEARVVDRYGNTKDVLLTVSLIPGTGESVASILDITGQREAEKRLGHLASILNSLVEALPYGVILFDRQNRGLLANKTGTAYLGSLANRSVGDVVDTFAGQPLSHYIGNGAEVRHEQTGGTSAGNAILRITTVPVRGAYGLALIITDITREHETLQHAETQSKLVAVGDLASGIAHDFNNILNVILGLSELMLIDISLQHKNRERVSLIAKQVEKECPARQTDP